MADIVQFLHESLTEREQEIVELIAAGLSNQQIAERLYLTRDTVKWYTRQIYQKLGVHSRTQAVAATRALPGISAPAVKNTLPVQHIVFIGRAQELAAALGAVVDLGRGAALAVAERFGRWVHLLTPPRVGEHGQGYRLHR
jgi:DNA-binding CsgD family transcriptional regulator